MARLGLVLQFSGAGKRLDNGVEFPPQRLFLPTGDLQQAPDLARCSQLTLVTTGQSVRKHGWSQ